MKSNYGVPIGDREKHGDTYEKYCQRCQMVRIEPKEFRAWLAFELRFATRRGPHPKLDEHQRMAEMLGQQLQA